MSNTAKNITWIFGIAAGTAAAFFAGKTSKKFKQISAKRARKLKPTVKTAKDQYDDSEIHYV